MKQAISIIIIIFSIFISWAQTVTSKLSDIEKQYASILARTIPDSNTIDFLTSYALLRR